MKILDCTLRDGGYYTNWDFDRSLVDIYIDAFNGLPVEYLEVGYRSLPKEGYLGEYFYCPVSVLERLKNQSNKKLVIILNEKDVPADDVEDLLKPCVGLIDMVRLAIDPKNFKRALTLAREVKNLGFKVGFNVMYMSTWKDQKDFLDLVPEVDGLADYFYLVDSFGGVYPEDVREIINLIRSRTKVKLGFHGHNNLEMALANTLTAIDCGIDIVDGTITGMGRGAGNLKTELLFTVLNSKGLLSFDYNMLSKVVDPFAELQKKYEWGTNLPYMVSGANSIPQKQVMEWVSNRFYSFNSIIRALTREIGKEGDDSYPFFTPSSGDFTSKVLVVGGGPSVSLHQEALIKFLQINPDISVIHASSRNSGRFRPISNNQYHCLVGNEGYRLESVFSAEDKPPGMGVLPPSPRIMGTYVPASLAESTVELPKSDFYQDFHDSHTALALQTSEILNAEVVYVVGYDGYSDHAMGAKEQALFMENETLFKKLIQKYNGGLLSLTPTKYSELKQDSIYSYLI